MVIICIVHLNNCIHLYICAMTFKCLKYSVVKKKKSMLTKLYCFLHLLPKIIILPKSKKFFDSCKYISN